MAKALIFIADGYEELEAVTVVDILRRAHIVVDVCSVIKPMATSARNLSINADIHISEADASDYDAVILPGGIPGAHHLNDSKEVFEILKKMNAENKLICAICAAPYVLAEKGFLDGKTATCYPSFKDYIKNYSEENVVTDGNIITSRGPATAPEFAFTIVAKLKNDKTANEIKKAMLYV